MNQMLSKKQISLIRSLQIARFRKQTGLFLAEGETLVGDLLDMGLVPQILAASSECMSRYRDRLPIDSLVVAVDPVLMKKISALSTPSPILGVFCQPPGKGSEEAIDSGLILYLDGLRDPGNLGTIIRTADWFGVREIVLSPDCTDPFNPKCVQSSMGSVARISLRYSEPDAFFLKMTEGREILGALLEGKSIYSSTLPAHSILVVGNEAQGIRSAVKAFITKALTIPRYQDKPGGPSAESLNAAIAAGIFMAEIRKQQVNTSTNGLLNS